MEELENSIIEAGSEEVVSEPEVIEAGSDLGKVIFGLGLIATAGIAAFVYKNRDKLEQRTIARLRRKGYTVLKDEPTGEAEDDSEEVIEVEECE